MTNAISDTENTFVIGDVHGCYHTLMHLIEQFPQDAKLVFVGDLCDKGNFSKEVIDFVIENDHLCVKGNHEHLFEKHIINAIEHDVHSAWSSDKRYGGLKCIESYKGNTKQIRKHLKWIQQLPIYLQMDRYFITHGFALGYYRHRDDKTFYKQFLLNRLYEDTIEPAVDEDIVNIFGHCVFEEVQIGNKFICLDTGCSKGGKLSAYSLKEKKIYQQPMESKDSDYSVKELQLKHIDLENFELEHIHNITLQEKCRYAEFDVLSNEVLEYIVKQHPKNAKSIILTLRDRSVIFPKQVEKVLSFL